MGRDFLGGFGPDANKPQAPRITKNGPAAVRDTWKYAPPQGPIGLDNFGPGLGGVNYGNCGTQGPKAIKRSEGSGSPRNKGDTFRDGYDSDDQA